MIKVKAGFNSSLFFYPIGWCSPLCTYLSTDIIKGDEPYCSSPNNKSKLKTFEYEKNRG